MNKKKMEQVALFRYGIIFPLLNEQLERGQQEEMINEICSKDHEIPFSTRTRVTRSTVLSWLRAYKVNRNIEDLMPRQRSDKGQSKALDSEDCLTLIELRKANPEMPITVMVDKAVGNGDLNDSVKDAMSSVYRLLNGQDLGGPAEEKDRRRFEMESCNDMWMLDAMSGPKVWISGPEGNRKVVTAKCFALLDDKSRLIAHAEFYPDETAESLMNCLWKAMNKCGLPRRVFTDNGAAMRDERLALGLADLEVQLSFCKPYQPQGKAKLERFWRTLRNQLLSPLDKDVVLGLGELNKKLKDFVDAYNKRYHSSIGMSPIERYSSDLFVPRKAPLDLPVHFRRRVERKVSDARTVQIDNRLFQVPYGYSRRKVELRFFDLDGKVEVWYSGQMIGTAEPVDLVANSKAHRHGEKESNG